MLNSHHSTSDTYNGKAAKNASLESYPFAGENCAISYGMAWTKLKRYRLLKWMGLGKDVVPELQWKKVEKLMSNPGNYTSTRAIHTCE